MLILGLQWGRGLSTAEIRKAREITPRESLASMGPRSFNRGNRVKVSEGRQSVLGLQWGRGLSTAEICPLRVGPEAQAALQWGRGLSTAEMCSTSQAAWPPLPSFNGAAVFQPRKCGECRGPPARAGCFNGAAVFQPRKSGRRQYPRLTAHAASMGPRSFNRGNAKRLLPDHPGPLGFNGAAVFQPRKWHSSQTVASVLIRYTVSSGSCPGAMLCVLQTGVVP